MSYLCLKQSAMEENLVKSLQVKEEPIDYEDDYLTELNREALDLNDVLVCELASDAPPATEGIQQVESPTDFLRVDIKTEPEADLDNVKLENDVNSSPTLPASDRVPQSMEFVDPDDVLGTSTSLVKEEQIDPLSDLKLESHSCLVGAQQSSTDETIENSFCVRELSATPVTHPSIVPLEHLEIPGDLKVKHHELLIDAPLQSLSSDAGMLLAGPSVETSAEGTESSLQLNQSKIHGEGPTTSQQQPQDLECNCFCQQCLKSLRSSAHLCVPTERHAGGYSKKCAGCQKKFIVEKLLKPHLYHDARHSIYQCPECDKSFKLKTQLNVHLKEHRAIDPHTCPECNKRFTDKKAFRRHLTTHSTERPFQCPECDKRFGHKEHLRSHLKCHSSERPFQCTQCEKSFKFRTELKVHLRTHNGERPCKCPQCNKGFTEMKALTRHMITHSDERPFNCPICDKRFTQKGHLNKHIKCHDRERLFPCSHCNERFKFSSELKAHLREHGDIRPHVCPLCSKRFREGKVLNRHMITHSDERPFHCPHCDKTFSQKGHLTSHVQHHNGARPHHCSQCEQRFTKKSHLNKHACCPAINVLSSISGVTKVPIEEQP